MTTDITKYADKAMYEAAPMADGIQVYLVSATPDPLGAIAAACRMYEGKPTHDLATVTDLERKHYWEQVQQTHLKAPMEFVDLHFFIEGVTRAFTHQMVRQRTAVYAQESMRFAVKDNFAAETPYPPSLTPDRRKERAQWGRAMRSIEATYNYLIAQGIPAEDARGILPHQTTTRLNYKTNLRNLIDHAGNRLCTQAQFEWRSVFIQIVTAIMRHTSPYQVSDPWKRTDKPALYNDPVGDEPLLVDAAWQWRLIGQSGVFKPVCFQIGHCPFTADFDRGCTIRPRVEEGKFDDIQPQEWLADPRAAWVT